MIPRVVRHDPVVAQLREKRGGTGTVVEHAQSTKRVFRPQREHGAEGVGIDTDASEFAQQQLESLLVRHRVTAGYPLEYTSNQYRAIAGTYTKVMPRGLNRAMIDELSAQMANP